MLVLTRKLGERILIGDAIVVTVVDIDQGRIRLGIEAPRDTAIMREELVVKRVPVTKPTPPPTNPG